MSSCKTENGFKLFFEDILAEFILQEIVSVHFWFTKFIKL